MLIDAFLFLSVSTRDKRDEINIFVAGDPCRKEYPIMLKVFEPRSSYREDMTAQQPSGFRRKVMR